MIRDIRQSAHLWIADVMEEFGRILGDGDDPSMELEVMGAKLQIRLMNLPGYYSYSRIEVPIAAVRESSTTEKDDKS